MRRTLLISGLAAAIAAPLVLAPASADAASCRDRKVTGTLLGGVGGALLGSAVSDGAAGTVIGGVGGAVVGHEIGRRGCNRYQPAAYRSRPAARSSSRRYSAPRAEAPRPVRYVYYDQYGQPISAGPAPAQAGFEPVRYDHAGGGCRTVYRSYYDDRGQLGERPVQVCDR